MTLYQVIIGEYFTLDDTLSSHNKGNILHPMTIYQVRGHDKIKTFLVFNLILERIYYLTSLMQMSN